MLRRWPGALAVAVLAGLAADAARAQPPPAVAASPVEPAQPCQRASRERLAVGAGEREYLLRRPCDATVASGRRPLVIVLHGGRADADAAERMTGFSALAAREGFIVAYPEGSAIGDGGTRGWHAGPCCGDAARRGVDDVGFLAALIDTLSAREPVDPDRIYLTGFSAGAMLAHRAAIALAPRLAAIAPVAGALFGDEPPPAAPVSMLAINGARDEVVPLAGGGDPARVQRVFNGQPPLPAAAQSRYWAQAAGCRDGPAAPDDAIWHHRRERCAGRIAVESLVSSQAGHEWPGGYRSESERAAQPKALDATRTVWAFFRSHPRVPRIP